MYVAVQGGEQAIEASYALLDEFRRGDPTLSGISVAQIRAQLGLLVSRVMAEASVMDTNLAALAIKQACGDVVEAVFLLRAYRSTLPRFGSTRPLDLSSMRIARRVSAIYKDLPGGQVLGPTFDYTQRLLDFSLLDSPEQATDDNTQAGGHLRTSKTDADATAKSRSANSQSHPGSPIDNDCPDALASLCAEGLIEPVHPDSDDPPPPDITREPPRFPLNRAARLQMMARADEGWLLGMAYSTQRGYAHTHPFGGEIRIGTVDVVVEPEELGFEIAIGEIELTECKMINQFTGNGDVAPVFTRGYGLVAGNNERKAMAMSLVDRAMRFETFGERQQAPAQDQEFVLAHGDSVEASGFVQHLKLPHYVTFESELQLIRQLREEHRVDPSTLPEGGNNVQ